MGKKVPKELLDMSELHSKDIKSIIHKLIENRGAQGPSRPDFLELVSNMKQKIPAQRETSKDKKPLSKKQLKSLSDGRKKLKAIRTLKVPPKVEKNDKREG